MGQSPHVRPEFSSCFLYISRSAQPSGGRAYTLPGAVGRLQAPSYTLHYTSWPLPWLSFRAS